MYRITGRHNQHKITMATLQSRNRAGISILFWCCLFLTTSTTFGQPGTATSQTPYDTAAIINSLELARGIMYTFPDSAATIARQRLEQSRHMGFAYGTGRSLLQQGINLSIKGAYDEAVALYVEAIPYLNQTEQGKKELPRVYNNLGNVYYRKGAYATSLKYYYKALEIATTSYPYMNADYICTNLAGGLASLGRDPESVNYYLNQAEQMAFQHRNYAMLGSLYNNKGFVYIAEKSWDKCFYYFGKALAFSRAARQPETECLALTNLGIVWLGKEQGDSALHYLLLAKKIEGMASASTREMANAALGNAYLISNEANKAKPLILEQYRTALASGNILSLREASYSMSELYAALKNYPEAYRYTWKYITYNDSVSRKEIVKNVNQLEVDYRTAEKEKKIVNAKLKIVSQEKELELKNKWITLIVCGAFCLLLLALYLRSHYIHKQKLLAGQLENMEKKNEIETLRATIKGEEQERIRIARELHDGLGAMTTAARINLGTLGKEHYSPEAQQLLQQTTQLLDEISTDLRFTAHNMMPKALIEKNLPEAINAFCEYIRISKGLDIQVTTLGHFEALPDSYLLSTYRIVQELVHNAEKHANATRILVQLSFSNNLLLLTVEDNGSGFDRNKLQKPSGIGLDSIAGRVRSLGGTLSFDTGIGKGTAVEVEIVIKEPGLV